MSAQIEKAKEETPVREEIQAKFAEEGLSPHGWDNGPNYGYGWHSHGYHKVLYCVSGSIIFHTGEGDFELEAGDRLDVETGTGHSATVGPKGVQCIEAAK